MPDPIIHVEFSAHNHAETAQWYARVFDWKVESMPNMEYSTGGWSEDRQMGAGFTPISAQAPAGTIVPYIAVQDLDAYVERVVAAGGSIVRGRVDLAGVGAMAWFEDPSGNTVGLIQVEMPQ
jgi:predicted enzyme related to lactoylglutathione lyase